MGSSPHRNSVRSAAPLGRTSPGLSRRVRLGHAQSSVYRLTDRWLTGQVTSGHALTP
jgi:hypothetical protein